MLDKSEVACLQSAKDSAWTKYKKYLCIQFVLWAGLYLMNYKK